MSAFCATSLDDVAVCDTAHGACVLVPKSPDESPDAGAVESFSD